MEKTFELKNLKWEGAFVDCKYKLTQVDDEGISETNDYHVKLSKHIHADLENLFEDLRGIVAGILDNTQYIAEVIEKNSNIFPDSVSFAGQNDNIGIVISGVITTKFGSVKFKTPRIKYKTSESEVAARLTVFADAFVNEVYAYLFEDKVAELSVFGE